MVPLPVAGEDFKASHETIWIDIHPYPHPRREAERAEPVADYALKFGAAAGVEEQAVAVAASEQRHRGGGGAEDGYVVELGAGVADVVGRRPRFGIVFGRNNDRRPSPEWRRACVAAGSAVTPMGWR